ncbi:MAG: STAS domain-containing protein [Anaerolineae bacterium]|nr:STAS domain-containing protein [Anaerolineae bacterium]
MSMNGHTDGKSNGQKNGLSGRLDRSRLQLFEVSGRVNEDSVSTLITAIERALAAGRSQVILDLSGVEYMNSAGLRALVQAYKAAQGRSGTLQITNPSPRIRELFALVGLDTIFGVGPDAYPDYSALFADTRFALQRQAHHLG